MANKIKTQTIKNSLVNFRNICPRIEITLLFNTWEKQVAKVLKENKK